MRGGEGLPFDYLDVIGVTLEYVSVAAVVYAVDKDLVVVSCRCEYLVV